MSAWKTITFKIGAEWAPDSPYGLDVLQLEADGRFHYENHVRGQATSSSGRIEPTTLEAVAIALRTAGFPKVPAHDIPPGGSLVELTAEDDAGSHKAYMEYHAALKLPGYGDLIRNFGRWTTWLRNGGAADAAPTGLTRD
jgi:hypothetical protein